MRMRAARGASADGPPSRALVVTADGELLDDILRLAAAASVEVDVVPDPVGARASWSRAALVLVGDDVSRCLAGQHATRAGLRGRPGVVLVGRDLDDAGVWRRAVAIGAEHVAVLPDAEPWLVTRLGEAAEGPALAARVVGVVGGRGGAGASTLAAALAVTGLRRGLQTMLIDADPLGGGADLTFGGEEAAGLRWPDLATAYGRIASGALRDALPAVGGRASGGTTAGGLAVLAWDRGELIDLAPQAMTSVLDAASRACQLVVVDLARHFDEIGRVALAACDLVLLVVPAEVRAAAAAARVASSVQRFASDVRLVVRGPSPGGLDADDVVAAFGLPLAGSIRPEPDLASSLERGDVPASSGRGPLAEFCDRVIDEVLPS